jgi:Amt family ammonium transporter
VISGVFGFWIVGFGLAFGPSDPTGFIGMSDSIYTVSAHFDRYTVEDLNLKWIFQFAFANTSSAIVSGLLMERCRIETYGAFSFLITLFIYPIVAGWEWNPAGWLAVKGFHDFAGCAAIHTLGGICGLVGTIMCGPRYNLFQGVQFPFLFRETREAKNKKFLEE